MRALSASGASIRRGLAAGALALGCQSDAASDDPAPTSSAATSESSGEPDAGSSSGGLPDACAGPQDPGPAPLRRLTPREYNNTVRDLFPGVPLPWQEIAVDPVVHGFEDNAEVQAPSALLIEQYQRAALAATQAALAEAATFLPCPADGGPDPSGCGRAFLRDFGARAFRRPLAGDEEATYLGFFDQQLAEHGFVVGLALTLQAFLQAPPFLYLLEDGAPTGDGRIALSGHALAARLSYFLWDTTPDAELLAAASAGELDTPEGLAAAGERMLADPRARDAAVDFFRQWLAFDAIDVVDPDPQTYPEFTPELRASMRAELERFVAATLFEGPGTLSALLTSPAAEVDAPLAGLYELPPPPPGGWASVELDPRRRAGLLTRAGFLAATAHAIDPSPVRRGVFVLTRLLCAPPPAPPPNVDTSPPAGGAPGDPQTNRERYDQHAARPECAGCHLPIDGVGFGFEHYDALGRWRDVDAGVQVDASGELVGTDVDGPFDGALDLSRRLADSAQVRGCLVLHVLRHALGRSEDPADACRRDELEAAFAGGGGDLRRLFLALVTSDAFRHRRAP